MPEKSISTFESLRGRRLSPETFNAIRSTISQLTDHFRAGPLELEDVAPNRGILGKSWKGERTEDLRIPEFVEVSKLTDKGVDAFLEYYTGSAIPISRVAFQKDSRDTRFNGELVLLSDEEILVHAECYNGFTPGLSGQGGFEAIRFAGHLGLDTIWTKYQAEHRHRGIGYSYDLRVTEPVGRQINKALERFPEVF